MCTRTKLTLLSTSIKEIINASKVINTPIITAKLVSPGSEQAARIVKGRIEKTYLRDIAATIAPCYRPDEICVIISIDMEAIRLLQLEVNMDTIKEAIIASKLKIGYGDVLLKRKSNKLRIYPGHNAVMANDRYGRITQLIRQLPNVVVKGIMSCGRAIISEVIKGEKELAVEGNGLREVMCTDGERQSHQLGI